MTVTTNFRVGLDVCTGLAGLARRFGLAHWTWTQKCAMDCCQYFTIWQERLMGSSFVSMNTPPTSPAANVIDISGEFDVASNRLDYARPTEAQIVPPACDTPKPAPAPRSRVRSRPNASAAGEEYLVANGCVYKVTKTGQLMQFPAITDSHPFPNID